MCRWVLLARLGGIFKLIFLIIVLLRHIAVRDLFDTQSIGICSLFPILTVAEQRVLFLLASLLYVIVVGRYLLRFLGLIGDV